MAVLNFDSKLVSSNILNWWHLLPTTTSRELLALAVLVIIALIQGYVFEAWDKKKQRKVALKRIEKVGNQLSR